MLVPDLLPRYSFSLTEACMMWAHVEATIGLAIEQTGERVHVAITVTHGCDPFGDHQEWAWTARLEVDGTVAAGDAPGTVRITTGEPIVPVLTFDATVPAHDTMWTDDSERRLPPFDFWAPLFAWGWARQARTWSGALCDDDLVRVIGSESAFMRVEDRDSEWGSKLLVARVRFHDDGRFSVRRSLGYALEPGARCEKRRAEAPATNRRGWVIVFCAYPPSRIVELLASAPPADGEPDAVGYWYRHHAGRRPEYALFWLTDEHDADAWLAFLKSELEARLG